MANDNLVRLQDAYAQWHDSRGANPQAWLDLCDEKLSQTSLAMYRDSESRIGKAAFQAYLGMLAAEWDEISVEVDEFIGDGDRIVVLSRVTCRNRATGKALVSPKVDIYRFRYGKIVESVEHLDTAALAAARS
ncbi:MAG: hypothetical protein JWP35_428 [Caulobacter sp.]|nr:hypothetical protein [Caulobacter sp.]